MEYNSKYYGQEIDNKLDLIDIEETISKYIQKMVLNAQPKCWIEGDTNPLYFVYGLTWENLINTSYNTKDLFIKHNEVFISDNYCLRYPDGGRVNIYDNIRIETTYEKDTYLSFELIKGENGEIGINAYNYLYSKYGDIQMGLWELDSEDVYIGSEKIDTYQYYIDGVGSTTKVEGPCIVIKDNEGSGWALTSTGKVARWSNY